MASGKFAIGDKTTKEGFIFTAKTLNTKAMTSSRGCKNNPDLFSGEFTTTNSRKPINDFVRKVSAYFELKLGDQNKLWTPDIVCKTCQEHLN